MVIKVDHKASLNARNMIFTLSHIPLWCKRVLSKIQNVYGTRQGSRITCAWAPLEIIFQIKIRLNHYKTIWKSSWNSSRQKHCSTKRIHICTQSNILDFRVRRSPNALLNYVIISSKSSRITKLIRHGFLLQWELDLDLDFFPHWICWQKVSKFDDHWILILEMLLTIPQVREELRSALSSAYAAKL